MKTEFLQAKTFGSLIHIDNQHLEKLIALKELLQAKEKGTDPAAKQAALEILLIVNQSILIAQRYDSVIANPPYMGLKGMNNDLKEFAKHNYKDSKSDLFSIFIERGFKFAKSRGYCSFVTMQSWLFLSTYESLRKQVINDKTLRDVLHIGYNSFPELNSKVVQCAAVIIQNTKIYEHRSSFINLNNAAQSANKKNIFLSKLPQNLYRIEVETFLNIPSQPIAYWINEPTVKSFINGVRFGDIAPVKQGLATADNDKFLRLWAEVSHDNVGLFIDSIDNSVISEKKWFPYNKGGDFRKWYGNNEYLVNWKSDGEEIRNFSDNRGNIRSRAQNTEYYFKQSLTWSFISSKSFGARFSDTGAIFDVGGSSAFPSKDDCFWMLVLLCSKQVYEIMKLMNPTLNFQVGNVASLPVLCEKIEPIKERLNCIGKSLVKIHKRDWDRYEQAWGFSKNPLIDLSTYHLLKDSFQAELESNKDEILKVQQLESEANLLLINAYGLESQITSEIDLANITLSINPLFRYGEENAARFRSDSISELISYSLGCIMGRYSLDRAGIVYAHSANKGFKELEGGGAYKTFPADEDGIIPLASEEWLFYDDASTRFKMFVRTVWGEDHLTENLEFVAESLCLHALKPLSNKKGSAEGAMDTISRYFSTQFYKDHCKTYKKRPIYWLFSSGKEKAFECLVYLHRYNEGTLSRMRTEYVTPLMGKYEGQHTLLSEQHLQATGTEARTIEKDLKSLEKKQAELRTFDEQLKHYAEKRITLDLDDGVKANYGKFGNLLADVKAIHGKAVK